LWFGSWNLILGIWVSRLLLVSQKLTRASSSAGQGFGNIIGHGRFAAEARDAMGFAIVDTEPSGMKLQVSGSFLLPTPNEHWPVDNTTLLVS